MLTNFLLSVPGGGGGSRLEDLKKKSGVKA